MLTLMLQCLKAEDHLLIFMQYYKTILHKETACGSSKQDLYLLYILLLKLLKVELVQYSGFQPRGRASRKGH